MKFRIRTSFKIANLKLYNIVISSIIVSFPVPAFAQCAAPPAEAGVIIFNSAHKVMQYCNGDDWVGLWGGGGGGSGGSVPEGAVMSFDRAACPEGWSEYLPARGRFVRGIDNGTGNDPDGTRVAGHVQLDAIQNIVGTFYGNNSAETGAFNGLDANGTTWGGSGGGRRRHIEFDASRIVRTSTETRPKNVALLYCRKD